MRHQFLIGLTSTVVSVAAFSQSPSPGTVAIESFDYTGSGCPGGSVAANISSDGQAMTLLFDDFIASSDETQSGLSQKSCKVNVKLRNPPGYQYSVFCVDYRGYADLASGVSGSTSASVKFANTPSLALGSLDLQGPLSKDYTQLVAFPLNATPWSNCGDDSFTIDTHMQVDARSLPAEHDFHLSSGRGRYNSVDLGQPIASMLVVRKHSSSACREGRSFGFNGSVAWVNRGCRADFKVVFAGGGATPQGDGLMTVDSLDGHVKQHYGIAWRQCTPGRWVQGNGNDSCDRVCSDAGLRSSKDGFGAQCASGEARPASATGQIQFVKGCWPNCAPEGDIATEVHGKSCYKPGQKKDNDRTDRIVGCYCN